jgi:hypothetical protein
LLFVVLEDKGLVVAEVWLRVMLLIVFVVVLLAIFIAVLLVVFIVVLLVVFFVVLLVVFVAFVIDVVTVVCVVKELDVLGLPARGTRI